MVDDYGWKAAVAEAENIKDILLLMTWRLLLTVILGTVLAFVNLRHGR
jgi:hypothetical protein